MRPNQKRKAIGRKDFRYVPSAGAKNRSARIMGSLRMLLPRFSRFNGPRRQPLVADSQREKIARKVCRNAAMAGVAFAIVAIALWGGMRLLAASDVFQLTSLELQGNRMVNDAEVLTLAGIEQGMNLLRLDLSDLSERIAAHPWIDQVRINRSWPSALQITIKEFQPLALVNMVEGEQGKLAYVNADRFVFAEVGQGQDIDFPVITGPLEKVGLVGRHFREDSLAAEAFQLLLLAARGGDFFLPIQGISEINLDPEEGMIVYLVDKPFPIFFGKDKVRTKFHRLVKVLEDLYNRKDVEDIKEIRMDYTENKVLVARTATDR